MFHFFGTATNTRGDSLPAWQVEVVQFADGETVIPIFSDENGTAIETVSGITNRALTDNEGNYDFWVDSGQYSLRFYDENGEFQRLQRGLQMYGEDFASEVFTQATTEATVLDTDYFMIARGDTVLRVLATDAQAYFGGTPTPSPTPTPPPITAVAADGWQATSSSPTDPPTLTSFAISRQGYDATGTAALLSSTILEGKRVRQDYPNEGTFTTDQVALSEPVCAADAIAGVTNNSTLVSPKPICAWTMPHRRLVTDGMVKWSISAFHWAALNGKPVACVRVRANDGTSTTAWQTVTTPTVNADIEDANPVAEYIGTHDASGLAGASFWLEAQVFPHVGVSASIADTEVNNTAGANPREFTRRYFRKGAIPAWVAVESTGNDTTGAISTVDEATALTTPCLTVAGALKKLRDFFGATEGSLDGCRIVIKDTVNSGAVPFTGSYKQDVAGVVITRATGTTRANAVMTMNANFAPDFDSHSLINEGSLIIEDCSIVLSGARSFQGVTGIPLDVQIVNCNLDMASNSTLLRATATNINYLGVVITNYPVGALQPLAANGSAGDRDIRLMRGVTANIAGLSYESFVTIGCDLTDVGSTTVKDHGTNGHIWYNNTFYDCRGTGTPISFRPGVAFDGLDVAQRAVVQNIVEWTSTTSNPAIIMSGTDDYGNSPHVVIHHNTVAGVEDHGRANLHYDETTGAPRTYGFVSDKGNLYAQYNIKGMVFEANAANNNNEIVIHGTGCAGNFARDNAAGPDISFAQAYPGPGSVIDGGDPLFTDNQAVTGTTASPVAGAGGGTYTLQVGSPARDLFSQYLLSHDIAGNARATTGTIDAGAYA